MRINVSAWSIRRPVPAIVLFAVLMLLGVISFKTAAGHALSEHRHSARLGHGHAVGRRAGRTRDASHEGRRGRRRQHHRRQAHHVDLTDGMSTTVMEFRLEINQDRALNDVKDAIARSAADLPRTIDEPIIQRIDVEGQSILTFAASSPGMTLEQLSWHVDDVDQAAAAGPKGVGRVERYGGVDREIRIHLDPDSLLALRHHRRARSTARCAPPTSISAAAAARSAARSRRSARSPARGRSSALADTKIMLAGGREVRLKDLGHVIDDASEQRSFAPPQRRAGRHRSRSSASKGTSELSVADAVNTTLNELENKYPDVNLTKIDDAVAYTRGNYVCAMETLIEGAALAVLVVLLFLRNMRATLISAIALPLSAIPTFWAMSAVGLLAQPRQPARHYARHRHSRRRRHRRDREHRAPYAHGQIALSRRARGRRRDRPRRHRHHADDRRDLRARLVHGRHRRAVLQAVRPDRCRRGALLAARRAPHHTDDGGLPDAAHSGKSACRWRLLMRFYTRFLAATLRWRYATLVSGVALFSAAIYATTLLPTGFLPDEDTSRVVVSVELPPGTQLDDTRARPTRW